MEASRDLCILKGRGEWGLGSSARELSRHGETGQSCPYRAPPYFQSYLPLLRGPRLDYTSKWRPFTRCTRDETLPSSSVEVFAELESKATSKGQMLSATFGDITLSLRRVPTNPSFKLLYLGKLNSIGLLLRSCFFAHPACQRSAYQLVIIGGLLK